MIDRLFTAALTFLVLIGGTLAIGTAWFDSRSAATQQVVTLPAVQVVAKRTMPHVQTAASGAGSEAASSREQ